ncbi:MAG: hypothetical protein IJB41_06660 [Clostridia bacterium]|nr:hypothetical protein [Clostridia bacterium]
MKSIRVILALLLVACMMLAAGCGSEPAPKADPTPAPVVEETKKEETKTEAKTEETKTETKTEETKTEETTEAAGGVKLQTDSSVANITVVDTDWVDLVCGGYYVLAKTAADNTLTGWGRNSFGQVGYGVVRDDTIQNIQPVLPKTVTFAAGEQNSAAITEDGTIYIWGASHSGQIGDGTNTGYISPTIIKNYNETGDTIVSFAMGQNVIFALAEDGTLYCTGKNDDNQLGAPGKVHKTPVVVLEDVAKIATNGTFSMALKKDGTLWVTGEGKRGQLGLGADVKDAEGWTEVTSISDVAAIALGEEFALVLKNDGTVWGIGRNNKGQLAGTTEENTSAEWLQIAEGAAAIFADADTAGMIKTDNTLWMWGDNSKGQCGVGSDEKKIETPTQVMEDVKVADCGYTHAAAIKNDGTLWTWGNNYYYELCDGTTTNSNVPKQVLAR